jgi:pimeloyl-ACP methyl ester carboxylesterase
MGRPLASAVALLLLLVAAVAAACGRPPGRLVDIGSHRLHLYCTGDGWPTVVLDAGLGGTHLDWTLVQGQVSRHARTCSYDRAGYGWSEPGPRPRTSRELATELHRLLAAAGVPGPYVLVGHSLGGVTVRLYASRYPEQVAALVMVDSSSAGQLERFDESLPQSRPRMRGGQLWMSAPQPPAAMPARHVDCARQLLARPAARRAARDELVGLRESLQQDAAAWLPQPLPAVIISRGRREWTGTAAGERREAAWRDLQQQLVQRAEPAVHVVAEGSGHHVPLEAPAVVVAGIRTALEYARSDHGGLAAAIWPEHRRGADGRR